MFAGPPSSSIHIKLYLRAATVLDVYTVGVLKAFEIFLEAPSGLDRHNSVLSGWNVNLEHTLTVGKSLVVAILTTNLNLMPERSVLGGYSPPTVTTPWITPPSRPFNDPITFKAKSALSIGAELPQPYNDHMPSSVGSRNRR